MARALYFFRTIKAILCEDCLHKRDKDDALLNRLFGATFTCTRCGRTNNTKVGAS